MILQSEQEVLKVLKPIIDAYKKVDAKLNKGKFSYKDLPDFYPSYKKGIEYYERIKVHSEIGEFPEDLFKERSPNQTDKEFKYMKANYKQNTLPVYVDYLSTNTKCFNDGNWNLYFKEHQNDIFEKLNSTFQQYTESGIENTTSLENFVKFLVPNLKTVDANGVIAVRPKEIYYGANSETEDLIIDNSRLLEPQPYYFNCKQVLSDPKFDKDYFILESCEKSSVKYAGKTDKRGHVFEIYDQQYIWKVEQTGDFIDYTFNISVYYEHAWNRVPAMRLMGIPQLIGESVIHQSPFLFACDLLDLALMNENYLQCSIANTMFPYRVMLGSKCNYQHHSGDQVYTCNDGKVFDATAEREIDCPKCKGAGVVNRVSPMGEMLLFPKDLFNDGDTKMIDKALYYVSPETTASEFVMKKIDRDILKAYDVVKARPASQANGTGIGKDGTATGVIMDVKAQYAAVKMFSDQIFYLLEFLLDAIGWQRYNNDYVKPVLTYPVSFDFNTEQDYLSQIKTAREAQMPPFVIQNIIFKYLQTLYYNEKQTALIFNLIVSADRLLVLTQQEVMLKERQGQAMKWEVILHDSAIQLVDELIEENQDAEMCSMNDCTKGFFAIDFATQKQMLIDKAKKVADGIVSPSQTKQQAAVAAANG